LWEEEMSKDIGASAVAETGSRASMGPASSLHPTGFDSARTTALCEALTPSGDTKAAYHGEFKFDVPLDGYDEDGEILEGLKSVYVPWTTVKEIMAAILRRAEGVK
jgi:hypothetical protein